MKCGIPQGMGMKFGPLLDSTLRSVPAGFQPIQRARVASRGVTIQRVLPIYLIFLSSNAWSADPPRFELVGVTKIWDQAPHNAFTDLVRHNGHWFCAFREGAKHVSPDGAIRVLTSKDGVAWESAAHLTSSTEDLRDPKLTKTPAGKLMLSAAGASHKGSGPRHQSHAWFSDDGRTWSEPTDVGEPDYWLWRVTWHKSVAYGVGYNTGSIRDARLYRSNDGRQFDKIVNPLVTNGRPSEAALVFKSDDSCICLLRRDGSPTGLVGTAKPPYTDWNWKDLDTHIGGPQLIMLPSGRLLAAGRLKDGKVRTALCWLDPQTGRVEEQLALPSGGDTSYPGLVWHDGQLWVSYYSSHEGRSSIYLARVRIAE